MQEMVNRIMRMKWESKNPAIFSDNVIIYIFFWTKSIGKLLALTRV